MASLLFSHQIYICNTRCVLVICCGNLYKFYENPLRAILIAIFFECDYDIVITLRNPLRDFRE